MFFFPNVWLSMRLKSMFRPRRSSAKSKLDSNQAHTLKQNLRALLLTKEHLAAQEKPAARPA